MKARIIPTIPETVLHYNIGTKKLLLEQTAASLNMKCGEIPYDKAGESIGFLAGYNGFTSNGTSITAEGECLIFSGIDSKRLDMLLKAMRMAGLNVPLKAIVTATNQNKSVEWLLEELKKEHEAMTRRNGQ
ncbi:MAG: DUF3783 domain-containing protein [Oscillospiraceae bacterium]|nr:DUF3783 domain-containing protein [Oscillospiraceae bacterium]